MSRIRRATRMITTCACALGSLSAFADRLDMLGLGILRGDLGSAGYDINHLGQVAGYSSGFERGRSHAVLWSKTSGLTNLGTLPLAQSSEGHGINDDGTVVGSSDYWPFVWTIGTGMQPLILPAQRFGGSANDVTNTGLVVGFANATQTSEPIAVKWTGAGSVSTLPLLPGGTQSVALRANDEDMIVGWSDSTQGRRAVLWSGKGVQNLGILSGYVLSEATGINTFGTVVGSCLKAQGRTPFVWDAGKGMRALPLPPRFVSGWATGVSNNGTIIGAGLARDGITCALIWQNGGVKTLNEVAPAIRAAFTIYEANAINDLDQVTGTWIRAGVRSRGFMGKIVR